MQKVLSILLLSFLPLANLKAEVSCENDNQSSPSSQFSGQVDRVYARYLAWESEKNQRGMEIRRKEENALVAEISKLPTWTPPCAFFEAKKLDQHLADIFLYFKYQALVFFRHLSALEEKKTPIKRDFQKHSELEKTWQRIVFEHEAWMNLETALARRLAAAYRTLFLDFFWQSHRILENKDFSLNLSILPKSLPHQESLKRLDELKKAPRETKKYLVQGLLEKNLSPKQREQLRHLIESHPNPLEVANTLHFLQHYLNHLSQSYKKNPYQAFELKDPIEKEMQKLKIESGMSWELLKAYSGIELEASSIRPFGLNAKAEAGLNPYALERAKDQFKKLKNPIGRVLLLLILKEASLSWAPVDVLTAKMDLTKISLMQKSRHLLGAQQNFETRQLGNKEQGFYDYFSGAKIFESKKEKKIWSVGENGKNEGGQGDDLVLKLNE